jgi:hypothetical protein
MFALYNEFLLTFIIRVTLPESLYLHTDVTSFITMAISLGTAGL